MSFRFTAVIRHIKRSIKYEWKIGFQYVPMMTSVTLQVQQGAARCSKVKQGAAWPPGNRRPGFSDSLSSKTVQTSAGHSTNFREFCSDLSCQAALVKKSHVAHT